MEEKFLHEFEGSKFEEELDEVLSNSNWGDEVFISPENKVVRIDEGCVDLFYAQHKNLEGWTRVIR
jgi:hypothetical protein